MEKKEAREVIRRAIEGLTRTERAVKSEAIRRQFLELPETKTARTVMGFLPMPDEIDTIPILADMLAAGKRVFVPRTIVQEKRMFPVRVRDLSKLHVGDYGIAEPDTDEACGPEEIDLLIVPGRVFDRQGNRVGRGAGYYDRFMTTPGFRALRCGIAFECQVLPEAPHASYDVPVQILVTEDGVRRIG